MSTQTMAEYRQLGKSGLRVSVPIFGAMSFGDRRWNSWVIEEEQALPVLKAAYDRGINTIDTANMYSNGESEKIIRTFMEKYTIPRENLVIMTKAFFLVSPDPNVNTARAQWTLTNTRDHVNHSGLSRTALFHQVDASLARLGTSYIDSGKVRYLGASNLKAWQLAEMNRVAELNGWTQFVGVQVEYSMLYRNPELELIPYCEYKGIGVIVYSALLMGHLARPLGGETERSKATIGSPFEKKLRDSDSKIVQRVEELAKKKSWSMSHVALAWVASKVTSPIVGLSKVERLEESITTGKILSDEDTKYLEELYEVQRPRF
ncbi:Aldo/keto reductase [Ganoderma leucocontextum]|nr:Aldo/keto reductase [Ganoderma leucocontextum]